MDGRLEKFLERIGLDAESGGLDASLPTLRKLTTAMVTTVPFEQLDVALGRGVDPSIEAIFNKIVIHKRGGYCFENNGLMHAALQWLGFEVKRCLARVLLGPRPAGYTHMVNVVRIDDMDFLVDVGFGKESLREPLPLASLDAGQHIVLGKAPARRVGAAVLMYPDVYRLVDDCGDSAMFPGAFRIQSFRWRIWSDAGMPDLNSLDSQQEFWRDQYAFHPDQPVADSDIVVGNYYVSTKMQNNWFTNTRLAILLTPAGRKIFQANILTDERRTSHADLRALFSDVSFDADADTSENALLHLRTQVTISNERWFETLKEEFGLHLGWDYQADSTVDVSFADFLPGALANDAQMF